MTYMVHGQAVGHDPASIERNDSYLEFFNKKETEALKYKIVELTRQFKDLPKIVFCFENLNSDEIETVHKFGDVYFTLNRGEGFGLCTYTAKKICRLSSQPKMAIESSSHFTNMLYYQTQSNFVINYTQILIA